MRLDHDFVRKLLLEIEKSDLPHGPRERELVQLAEDNNFSRNELGYMITKLHEASFITSQPTIAGDEYYVILSGNLTYTGHEYLDNIRDPEIWNKTKEKISKVADVSLPIIGKIAVKLLNDKLGLN